MNPPLPRSPGILCAAALLAAVSLQSSLAQEQAPTAGNLAAQLSAAVLDNASTVRLKLETSHITGAEKTVLQLKVNARRTPEATDVHYQVLWPKGRQGESFVLRKTTGSAATGTVFVPPDSRRSLSPSQMQEGIFGSALSYEDLVDNYFAWENQRIVGEETVDRVPCRILESKPGRNDRSAYGSVRTWIDPKRLVPLRIEKFGPKGQLVRRIITTRVGRDDTGRQVPVNFTVERAGGDAVTVLEGSDCRHDVTLTDADFSPNAHSTEPAPGGSTPRL